MLYKDKVLRNETEETIITNGIVTLYHGSDKEIKEPLFQYGNPNNDYGQGFYTTLYKDKADSWACSMGGVDAITNEYTLDLTGLNVINLDEYGTLSWITTILQHRGDDDAFRKLQTELLADKYAVDISNADVVICYRADDSYIDIINYFLDKKLSVDEVEKLFKKGNLRTQYFIQSEEAFHRISFVKSYRITDKEEYHVDERNARKEVDKFIQNRSEAIVRNRYQITGITVDDAIDLNLIYDKNTDSYYSQSKGDR